LAKTRRAAPPTLPSPTHVHAHQPPLLTPRLEPPSPTDPRASQTRPSSSLPPTT
jgi:hypothetical protein